MKLYRIWNKADRQYWLAYDQGMTRSAKAAHLFTEAEANMRIEGIEDMVELRPAKQPHPKGNAPNDRSGGESR